MFLFLSHFFKKPYYCVCRTKCAQGQGYKMAILFCFKDRRPSAFGSTLSGEGQALSTLQLLICSPCHGKLRLSSWFWKGPQPGQVLEQEVHPGPAARSDDPDKGLPDNTALRELQGFFDVAFLGTDNMCIAQRFRSKMKCSNNVCSHAVFCTAGSAHHELSEDYA